MSIHDTLRETLRRLQSPVSEEETLLDLLSTPLRLFGIIPPKGNHDATSDVDAKTFLRFIPEFQRTLLQTILPHWLDHLRESGHQSLLSTYFMPRIVSGSLPSENPLLPWNFRVMECVIAAHSTLITEPISQFAVDTLSTIFRIHSPLDVFCYIFKNDRDPGGRLNVERWSDYLQALFAIVGRVSNAAINDKISVPNNLDATAFITNICHSFTGLMHSTVYDSTNETHQEAAALILIRLVNIGAFPSARPVLSSVISFWEIALPSIRTNALSRQKGSTSLKTAFKQRFRPTLFNASISSQLSIISSLLSHLNLVDSEGKDVAIRPDNSARCLVKREALVIHEILGEIQEEKKSASSSTNAINGAFEDDSLWSLLSSALNRLFTEPVARVVSCWGSFSQRRALVLETLLKRSTELWCDQDHIRHSPLKRHRSLTTLILTTIAEISTKPPERGASNEDMAILQRLSKNGAFITAVGVYISHMDPSVRRCGMLVAEVVAQRTGGKLKFPDWDGQGDGREWVREMRTLIEGRDSTADLISLPQLNIEANPAEQEPEIEIMRLGSQLTRNINIINNDEDSDDSLEGYDSSPSSRASSPQRTSTGIPASGSTTKHDKAKSSPTIEEINAEPTLLNPSRKKIHKPIYLLDLGKLFKVDKEGDEQCESIRMALQTAAELVRRKAGWGLELEENAVDLTCSLIGLQNNYDIEDFDRNVLEAVTALVVSCPRKVAPCIIEHFFTPSYSTSHRFMMLNALALGARELAGLPTPQITSHKPLFPSKLLPSSQHQRYITIEDKVNAGSQLRSLVTSISSQAIEAGRAEAEEKIPEIIRERHLTVSRPGTKKKGTIVELNSKQGVLRPPEKQNSTRSLTSFSEVATEYFIIPLISQFWNYLNDALGREERAVRSSKTGGYRATGTAMILSALVLSHLINTISIMVHASRHSPAFLSIISPSALELAVTLGTRKLGAEAESILTEESRRAASVLSASLELAIVTLDACIDLDKGKVLATDHGSLLSGVSIWAQKVFGLLESGVKLEGMGGEEEMRLSRASAGLIFKLKEISERWAQAMLIPY